MCANFSETQFKRTRILVLNYRFLRIREMIWSILSCTNVPLAKAEMGESYREVSNPKLLSQWNCRDNKKIILKTFKMIKLVKFHN